MGRLLIVVFCLNASLAVAQEQPSAPVVPQPSPEATADASQRDPTVTAASRPLSRTARVTRELGLGALFGVSATAVAFGLGYVVGLAVGSSGGGYADLAGLVFGAVAGAVALPIAWTVGVVVGGAGYGTVWGAVLGLLGGGFFAALVFGAAPVIGAPLLFLLPAVGSIIGYESSGGSPTAAKKRIGFTPFATKGGAGLGLSGTF